MANDEFDLLRNGPVPTPRAEARERALDAALNAYDLQNTSAATQGRESGNRLTERAWRLWRETMNKKMYATPAIAGLLALPIAGYTTYYLMQESPFAFEPDTKIGETADKQGEPVDRERTEDPLSPSRSPSSLSRRRPMPTRPRAAATSPPTCLRGRMLRRRRRRRKRPSHPSRISTSAATLPRRSR